MTSLWTSVTQHPLIPTIAALWLFSAAVSSMPTPTPASSPFYVWFYAFLHAICANLDQVAKSKGIPLPLGAAASTVTTQGETTTTTTQTAGAPGGKV